MKKLSVLLVALALVACMGVYATVAYFTDTAKVTNTFSVGKVKITLDEDCVDTSGALIPDSTRTPKGNNYHLVPGHSYKKDPQITIKAGSEPCYVRMQVTFNRISELDSMTGSNESTMPFINAVNEYWIYSGYYSDASNNTRTYEYRYGNIMGGNTADTKLPALFETFTVPGNLTGDQLNALASDFKIEIVGHAIQAEGFSSEDEAWETFGDQNGATGGTLVTPTPAPTTTGGTSSEPSVSPETTGSEPPVTTETTGGQN